MSKNKKREKKKRKIRLWVHVAAWFRNSAGAMKSQNKKKDAKKQRKEWKQNKQSNKDIDK